MIGFFIKLICEFCHNLDGKLNRRGSVHIEESFVGICQDLKFRGFLAEEAKFRKITCIFA